MTPGRLARALLGLALPVAVAASHPAGPALDCAVAGFTDLACVELIPVPRHPGADGRVVLRPAPSPFGASVDADGTHVWTLEIAVAGLPDAAELGPYDGFIAWATTPRLEPMLRLGRVGPDGARVGPVALDKFLVLVTAESGAGGARPGGPTVLRGTSPSMAMQPHELPAMLSAAVGRGHDHAARGIWVPPPMHPAVDMLPGLHLLRPDVEPWRPDVDPAGAPPARPTEILDLADGDSLTLVAAPVTRTIGGRRLLLYGFNGQIPGPLVRVRQGSTIEVRFVNGLELPSTVHWHGIRLENRFDGVPRVTQPLVPPGGEFRYRIRFPDAGVYWYHPHHREDVTQDLGLYGNLRVEAAEAGWLGPANREAYLVLDDLLVGGDGPVAHGGAAATHALMGRFGNVLLVNGEPDWSLAVDRSEVVRLFLTNVSNTRTFNVSFGAGRPIKVVGSDVGLFERETWAESVVIAPAERYIVEVLFEDPGTVAIENRVRAIDHLYGTFFSEVDTLGLVRVAERRALEDHAADHRRLDERPAVVAEVARYREAAAGDPDATLVLTVEADGLPFPLEPLMRLERAYFNPVEWSGTMPVMNWATTARSVRWILRDPATGRENMDIDWRFAVGDVVKIRLVNDRDAFHAMQHPIHVHGQRLLVVARDGVPRENLVWKDTLVVPAGTTADIVLDLANPGVWMVHCHIAEHLEAGMKTTFTVEER